MERRSRPAIVSSAALACLVLLLAALPSAAHAQGAGSATLNGTILDPTGAPVPDAALTLTAVRTRMIRVLSSSREGTYVFAALPAGPYRLRTEVSGFAPWESSEFPLRAGDNVRLDATLALAGQTEELTVTTEREMIRTDTGAREGVITAEQIQDLSIVSRSALELLRILPGTLSPDPTSLESVGWGVGGAGANDLGNYSINGGRGSAIHPILDGAPIRDFNTNTSLIITLNNDMVDEVKVQSSNYAAEYGSAPYQVSAVTKGGGASFHGSAYDYWRNWRFAANDRSNNYAGVPRPESNYQYPGFNLSGPLLLPGTDFNKKRDKFFFFVGFELQRQTVDRGTTLTTVPTVRQREGDFSELLADEGQNLGQPTQVGIPAGFPGAGQAAPNNDLSPYVDPMGQAFLNLYPLPNYKDPDNLRNYAFTELTPRNRWQLTTRLDWNVSAATHAYLRLALEREEVKWERGTWDAGSDVPLPSRVVGDNKAWSVAANVTSVLSPSLTNEIVVAASQLKLDNNWEDPSRVTRAALGLEGFQGVFPSDSPYVPLNIASWGQYLAGFETLAGGMPVYDHQDNISIADHLTKVAGAHTIKLGVFVERGQVQHQDDTDDGRFILGSTWTPGGTGNDYGDLLVGRMAQFNQGTEVPRVEFRLWNLEAYVQDSWKVARNVTVEAGVRLSKMTNDAETTGLARRFEPSAYDPTQGVFIDGDPARPNGVLLASRGEIPDGIIDSPGLKLMPRFNFAWDIWGEGETILRGGVGLFYHRRAGLDRYASVFGEAPNSYHAEVAFYDVPSDLTIPSLPTIDPWSRLAAGSTFSLDPSSVDRPRTWEWSAGVVQRLPWQQTLDVAYVGSRSEHLPNRAAANFIPPGIMTGSLGNADLDNPLHRVALGPGAARTLRPYPAYNSVNWFQNEAFSDYDALQVTLSRAAGGRLHYLLAYTLSQTWGTAGSGFVFIDPIDPEGRSFGVAWQDQPHVFRGSWSWIVPDPIRPDGDGVLRGLLNGWQLSGITSYTSGPRLFPSFYGALNELGMDRAWWGTDAHGFDNALGHVAPILLGDPTLDNDDVGEKVLNIGQFAIPALGESGPFRQPYGLRAPGRWNWDLTVMKNFALGGDKRLQIRVGIFNLFNQAYPDPFPPHWDIDLGLQTDCNERVDGVPNGAGGYAYGVCDPTKGFAFTELTRENFGKIITKRGHRVIELAARFDF